MFVTERRKSANHIYLEVLETRSGLSGKEKRDLKRYRSGYEGERGYDAVLDAVGHERFMSSSFYYDINEVGMITYMILIVAVILELVANKLKSAA